MFLLENERFFSIRREFLIKIVIIIKFSTVSYKMRHIDEYITVILPLYILYTVI